MHCLSTVSHIMLYTPSDLKHQLSFSMSGVFGSVATAGHENKDMIETVVKEADQTNGGDHTIRAGGKRPVLGKSCDN